MEPGSKTSKHSVDEDVPVSIWRWAATAPAVGNSLTALCRYVPDGLPYRDAGTTPHNKESVVALIETAVEQGSPSMCVIGQHMAQQQTTALGQQVLQHMVETGACENDKLDDYLAGTIRSVADPSRSRLRAVLRSVQQSTFENETQLFELAQQHIGEDAAAWNMFLTLLQQHELTFREACSVIAQINTDSTAEETRPKNSVLGSSENR